MGSKKWVEWAAFYSDKIEHVLLVFGGRVPCSPHPTFTAVLPTPGDILPGRHHKLRHNIGFARARNKMRNNDDNTRSR